MPNRVIREGLLDSGRYWSATIEARQLFVHMLLLADDLGCISVSPTFLRRHCFNDSPSQEKIAKLLNELVDVDLVRTYEVERSCFAFIPRFKQRLQRNTLRHPQPPASLYVDDQHANKLFSDINRKAINPTVGKPLATVGEPLSTVGQPPEVEVEVKPKTTPASDDAFAEFWNRYPRKKNKLEARKAWARLKPSPSLAEKILLSLEKAKDGSDWRRENGRYIPHPATWLNKGGYLDEPEREQPRGLVI